jgi:DNA repair photolyase
MESAKAPTSGHRQPPSRRTLGGFLSLSPKRKIFYPVFAPGSDCQTRNSPRWRRTRQLIEYLFDLLELPFYALAMRWDGLRLSGDGQNAQAPGAPPALFDREAVARTFDTPAFRGLTFYEVRARSIINRVPASSRMSFRWTINPYRGCSHGCSYCMSAETPVLMADGRTRPIAQLKVGDAIYGTVRTGRYRRYVITHVLAHWPTVKPGYRVRLADGTCLIASGEHRFLTERGWKHVIGTECRELLRRPHLSVNNKLMGVGAFAESPKESADYQRGYLCGMIRGDAHIYQAPGRAPGELSRFRLALADAEALDRTRRYLADAGIGTTEFTFAEESATRRRMTAIRTQARDCARMIQGLIEWPGAPAPDWQKGYLAGLFDAEGCYSQGVWRISNTDPQIIDRAVSSMQSLGFDVVVEDPHQPNGLKAVRLRGAVGEVLRFFHITDPAITRKRSIAGTAITGAARLSVVSVEPIGLDIPMFDITTGTGDFIADGVVSHNCFARNTHTYLDMDAGLDFNSRIVVKVNAPDLVRRELAAPRWQGEHVAMGTNVDCYQRAEGRYRLMPGIISALRDAANPFSILTKGTLLLRDLDLLADAAQVTDVGLNVSVGFIDRELSRSVEPGTPGPGRRLGVCSAVTERGLRCGVLMGPVLPFLTDSPGQLAAAVRQIAEAGAAQVSPIVLHLRPGAREWFLQWLAEQHPDLVEPYRRLYKSGAYAPGEYQQRITHQVRELAVQYRVGHASPVAARRLPHRGTREHSGGEHSNTRRSASRNGPPAVPPTAASRPAGVQETLL